MLLLLVGMRLLLLPVVWEHPIGKVTVYLGWELVTLLGRGLRGWRGGGWRRRLSGSLVRVFQLGGDKFAHRAGQVLLNLLVHGSVMLDEGPDRVVFGFVGTRRVGTLEGSLLW